MKARWIVVLPLTLLVLILLVAGQALAQGGGYTLTRGVTSNSGVVATAGQGYELRAALGQPFAGSSAAGGTQLAAGYWYRTVTVLPDGQQLYLPVVRGQ